MVTIVRSIKFPSLCSVACPLHGSRVVPFEYTSSTRVVFIGESPGRDEKIKRRPFIGKAGQLLRAVIAEAGIPSKMVGFINSAKCEINKKAMSNRQIAETLKRCRGSLVAAIREVSPKLLVVMGDIALRQTMKIRGIEEKKGLWYKSEEFNCDVFVMNHPAATLHDPSKKGLWLRHMQCVGEYVKNGLSIPKPEDAGEYKAVGSIQFLLNKKNITVALDTETQGLDWTSENSPVLCYSITDTEGFGYVVWLCAEVPRGKVASYQITVDRRTEKRKVESVQVGIFEFPNREARLRELRELLARKDIKKVMMHGTYDLLRFHQLLGEFTINSYMMDIQAAAHVLDENAYSMASLEQLGRDFTNLPMNQKSVYASKITKDDLLGSNPLAVTKYSAFDADCTLRAATTIRSHLLAHKQQAFYFVRFLQPALIHVLYPMQRAGLKIDVEYLPQAREELTKQVEESEAQCLSMLSPELAHKHEKKGLKLTRRDIARDFLFDPEFGLGLSPTKMTDTNSPSIGKNELLMLLDRVDLPEEATEFIQSYMTFNEHHTLLTRYINGLSKAINPDDSRIYPSYSIVATVTGRFAARDPNTLNIPKRGKSAKVIRRLFSAPPGRKLVAFDLSQSELRFIAHESLDPVMLEVYRNDEDIHVKTAEQVLGMNLSNLSEEEAKKARRSAKCFHPDTEVLTPTGWISMRQLSKLDKKPPILQAIPVEDVVLSSRLEWTHEYRLFLQPNHHQVLHCLHSNGIDIKITPDHRMVGLTHSNKLIVVQPDKVRKLRYMAGAGLLQTQGLPISDELLRFIVAVQADGSIRQHGEISFHLVKRRKIVRLQQILRGLKKAFVVSISFERGTVQTTTISIPKGSIADLLPWLSVPKKEFSWELLQLSPRQKGVFLEELAEWDAHKTKTTILYTSTINHNTDVAQAIAVTANRKAQCYFDLSSDLGRQHRIGYKDTITVSIKDHAFICPRSVILREEDYTGDVAVLSVPSTFVLVRSGKNKKSLITGQSINFGFIYGMQAAKFRTVAFTDYGIKLSFKEAEQWRRNFFATYPGILNWHEKRKREAHQTKQVVSLYGRIRHLPMIDSDDQNIVSFAERMAINAPIQGASSDSAVLAALEASRKKRLDFSRARLVLFVHDELVYEVEDSYVPIVTEVIKYELEHLPTKEFGFELAVPTKAGCAVGPNLAEMEEYIP